MKHYPVIFLIALGGLTLGPLQGAESATTSNVVQTEQLTPEQIDALLAPIALYPDPLVAIILPAATFPTDIVMAARYLNSGGAPAAIDNQTWDDSVKALARYPDVLKWMDQNLTWTQQVGAAFVSQPAALLTATQRLRAAAIAAGNLKESPQQHVVVENEVVRILPAQREIIYVPVYDPMWVYRPCPDLGPQLTFSVGYPAGYWLSYSLNWHVNTVIVIARPYRMVVWNQYPAWSYPHHITTYCQTWRPSPVCVQTVRREFRHRPDYRVVQPTMNTFVQHSPRLEPVQDRSTRVTERNTESPSHPAFAPPRGSEKTEATWPRRANLSNVQTTNLRAPQTETITRLNSENRGAELPRLRPRTAPEATLVIAQPRGFIQARPMVTSQDPALGRPAHNADGRPAAFTRSDRSVALAREQQVVRQQPASLPVPTEGRTRPSLTPSDDNASTTTSGVPTRSFRFHD